MKVKTVIAAILALLYSCFSIAYFSKFDSLFYIKNVVNCDMAFPVPLPYVILTALYIAAMYYLANKNKSTVLPLIAMSVVLPLFYFLIDIKIGIHAVRPFKGARGIYGIYAAIYILCAMSLASAAAGAIFKKSFKAGRGHAVYYIPVLIYLIYGISMLFGSGFALYAIYMTSVFLAFLLFELPYDATRIAVGAFTKLFKNEKMFLIALFVVSFLVRYFWGTRLIGLLGSDFIIASDDGPAYDDYASIMAGGGMLEKNNLYVMSGFGYWYFLAAIYKIFGIQNFGAIVVVQSIVGSFVPVLTYLIARKVFANRAVAAVSGLITAVDMTLVFLAVVIGMEAIYIPLVLLALMAAVYAFDSGMDMRKAFFIGCAFGLAYNARPPELLLFPFCLVFVIYLFKKKESILRKTTGAAVSLFAGFLLLVSVQYINNYVVYGAKPRLQSAVAASFHSGVVEGRVGENQELGEMGFSPFEDLKKSLEVASREPVNVSTLLIR